MKKWKVTDIRWANEGDLKLPLWYKWNRQNPLPDGFWQRIWEYPYVASKIPKIEKSLDINKAYPLIHNTIKIPAANGSFNYVFSISSMEETADPFKVLKEMIRVAKYRIVVTMDISDTLGIPVNKLREFEEFLKIKIPDLQNDALTSQSSILSKFRQNKIEEFKDIRTLAVTIDSIDTPKSIAVLVPHWNSLPFLKLCLEHIQKYHNKNLMEKIYVLDDSSNDGSFQKAKKLFKNEKNIEFHRIKRYNRKEEPDVGLLLDCGLKLVKEEYVATIDADLFPISKNWLAFPIWLIEKYNCSSAGLDTGLSNAYLNRLKGQTWWNPDSGYAPCGGLYDNSYFTCTNNLYRVMKTSLAKIVSEKIGFSRASPDVSLNKFHKWIKYFLKRRERYPYLPGGEDSGVAANHFIDINKLGPKFNIPLTSYIGLTPKDGAFGQNISGLAFHFALSTRALSKERKEVQNAGKAFNAWVNKLNGIKTINDKVLKKMINQSRHFQSGGYDGSIPAYWYKKEYLYIQKLLKEYNRSTGSKKYE
jgi:glycosyltransferase involved in cell wall biosynthesis